MVNLADVRVAQGNQDPESKIREDFPTSDLSGHERTKERTKEHHLGILVYG